MNPAVVVVGSYVQDLTWRCAAFPATGQTVVGRFATCPGGKGSNQAIAASRSGVETMFFGAIGRDLLGAKARQFYRDEKISAHFAEKPRQETGTAAILVNAAGENRIIVALGANTALRSSDLDPQTLRSAKVVVAQFEANLDASTFALRTAHRAGVTTVLNPAPMRLDLDLSILRNVDVLVPNEIEFAILVNRVRKAAAFTRKEPLAKLALLGGRTISRDGVREFHRICRTLGVPTVIVTLGERGCFVSDRRGGTFIRGHAVRAVDTTGAGDAFVGAFAAGLVRFNDSVSAATRYANGAAALSVTRRGTAIAMPWRADVDRFLASQGRR